MSFHCQFLSSEPLPSTLIPDFSFLTTPVSTNKAGVTSVPSSNLLSWSKLTIAYSLRLMLVKPRFGKRRNKGNCPPSNPGLTPPPERAFDLFDRDH